MKFELPNVDANLSLPQIDTDFLIRDYIQNDEKNDSEKVDTNSVIKQILLDDNITVQANNSIKKLLSVSSSNNSIVNSIEDINLSTIKNIKIKNESLLDKINTDTKEDKELKNNNSQKITSVKKYIAYVKNTIQKNTITLNNVSSNSLKIRITVLKNGNYQNIKFVGGNKKLYSETKKSIKKSFPMPLNDIIKEKFPRYLRLEIKFKSI